MEAMPENKIALQRATPEDVAALIAIDEKVASPTYSPILDEKELLADMEKGPFYLMKKGNETVGSISYERRKDGTVYIAGLAMDPKYQRQGFARQALQQVLEEVKDAPSVDLVTHPGNEASVALYTSLGFEITERKENYYGDGKPRVVMILKREKQA